jgi:hypothetical protein
MAATDRYLIANVGIGFQLDAQLLEEGPGEEPPTR